MDNVKPWQIILIVLGFGAIAFLGWRILGANSVPKTSGYMTVDIMTGQLYDIRKGKAKGVPLPAKHPDTGDRTLYPVNQVEDLTWEIPQGFNSFLTENVREGSLIENGKFEIEVLEGEPIKFVLLK